jgi:hypothetical protein
MGAQMASQRIAGLAAVCALVASGAAAQTPDALSPAQMAVACAPPPFTATVPADATRVIASQDSHSRNLFGMPDQLVVSGGTERGLQLGQQYFLRRLARHADNYNDKLPHQVRTSGWVRVVAVNATTTIVNVEHACGDILVGDYLDAFQIRPLPDADITSVDATGEPDFKASARVLYGSEERRSGGIGEFMLIDQGADHRVALGSHFAIYRDIRVPGAPLASIGEATVVSIGPAMALVRINRARDAVFTGDFVVPRSK